jgi:hypothetical protein
MAELFGTVAGALSVAALFNNCVECFEYIQLGRHFRQDYERCRLKLDIAQTRLSRWGAAAVVNRRFRFATPSPTDPSTQQIQSILEEISLLFMSVQKTSRRYELGAKPGELALLEDGDMQPTFQALHGRLRDKVHQRQARTSLARKVAWALYDKKNFDKLIEEIVSLVDALEDVYPVETARRQLAALEIEEVNDGPDLAAVEEAATGVDPVLAAAAAEKAHFIATKNHAEAVNAENKVRVRVGNDFAEAVIGRMGIVDQAINTAGTINAKGESVVHIGNRYGGPGILD